jgi:two-component system sensor histidine kinase EvgS
LSSSQDDTPQGLVAAYLALLQEQVPTLRATPVAATTLAAAALPAGTHAVLGWPRAQTPKGWVASVPYLQVPQVIVRRPDALPIHGLDGLHGRGVASLDTVPLARVLEESGAHVPLLQVAALDKALQLLISGQIDAVVGNLWKWKRRCAISLAARWTWRRRPASATHWYWRRCRRARTWWIASTNCRQL